MATTYPYPRLVAAAARRNRVPYGVLLGLLLTENATGARRAVSPTGDVGPAQIHLASHPGVTRAEAQSPAYSIAWAARYLRQLHDVCGSWEGALTQYNHGTALGCRSTAYSRAVLARAAQHGYGSASAGTPGRQAETSPFLASSFPWPLVLAALGAVLLLALLH